LGTRWPSVRVVSEDRKPSLTLRRPAAVNPSLDQGDEFARALLRRFRLFSWLGFGAWLIMMVSMFTSV
jgi:hypothetical protein